MHRWISALMVSFIAGLVSVTPGELAGKEGDVCGFCNDWDCPTSWSKVVTGCQVCHNDKLFESSPCAPFNCNGWESCPPSEEVDGETVVALRATIESGDLGELGAAIRRLGDHAALDDTGSNLLILDGCSTLIPVARIPIDASVSAFLMERALHSFGSDERVAVPVVPPLALSPPSIMQWSPQRIR